MSQFPHPLWVFKAIKLDEVIREEGKMEKDSH